MSARKVHRIVKLAGGKRVAFTNTSRIPDKTVVAALRLLSREVDLDGVVVHVKGGEGYRRTLGMAYNGIPGMANRQGLDAGGGYRWRYLITVTDSAFISTLAHEAKHVERYREGIDRKARAKHGKALGKEAACDAFGSMFWRKWQEYKTTLSGDGVRPTHGR